jgi:hypothetical protein
LTGKKIEKKPVTSVQTPPEIKETKVTESPHASAVPMKELKDQKFLSKSASLLSMLLTFRSYQIQLTDWETCSTICFRNCAIWNLDNGKG